MPLPDDVDPVQDLKAAREAAIVAAATAPPPMLGEVFDAWMTAYRSHREACKARTEAEEREKSTRYQRDHAASRLASALIAAGCDPYKLATVGGVVLRFNDAGHGQYWVEALHTQAVTL